MKRFLPFLTVTFWFLQTSVHSVWAQEVGQLIPHRVKLESVEYRGKRAVKVTEDGVVPNAAGEVRELRRRLERRRGPLDRPGK